MTRGDDDCAVDVATLPPAAPSGAAADLKAWNAALNETHAMATLRDEGGVVVRHLEARRRRLIVDTLRALAPRRLIDVGCEDGWLAESYAAFVPEVVLSDIDGAVLAKSRAAQQPGVRVIEADATQPAALVEHLGAGWADVVLLSALLEHLPDPHGALRALRSLLVPGGDVVVYLPADRPILLLKRILKATHLGGLVGGLSLEPAPGHLHTFARKDVVRLLRPYGRITRLQFDPLCLGYLAVVRIG
jgi:2-polyprenyl-3-methyl-5-hydroxy-6-metoxy-1,4-benzoquinol methylase